MTLGALTFLSPWLLTALAALPIIYWLLRTVPPRPQQISFPPTRILVGIENREKTPAKTPWWLLLIRLLAAALIIFALADPVLNQSNLTELKGDGPVAIVVDNGWSSAANWTTRQEKTNTLIDMAAQKSKPVIIVPTAQTSTNQTARVESPTKARSTASAIVPLPFAPDRMMALNALKSAITQTSTSDANIIWITDGVDHDGNTEKFSEELAALTNGGTFAVVQATKGDDSLAVSASVGAQGKLTAKLIRAGGPEVIGTLYALSARNEQLSETSFQLTSGQKTTEVTFNLPLELRNQVARVAIANLRSAAAISLLDARSNWHRIGLVSGESSEQSQPLLAPLYYIKKALAPYAELVIPKDSNLTAGIDLAIERNASVIVMADIGTLTSDLNKKVKNWVERGGILVRFAGPRLETGGDDLLPVFLRTGGRTLGGALSWSTPQPLAPFEGSSLFAGLKVTDEITISRQVLADPSRLTEDTKVWARLQDGTPLVTAASQGGGQVILFHVTANSDWSNLPMSGLFVDMLRRITTLGRMGGTSSSNSETQIADTSGNAQQQDVLSPIQTLDAFGHLRQPPPYAQAIKVADLDAQAPNREHPPGYYGPPGTPRALNIARQDSVFNALPSLPSNVERLSFDQQEATLLKPWLLAAALGLILLDIIAVLLLQSGGIRKAGTTKRPQTASIILSALLGIGLACSLSNVGLAQDISSADAMAQQATGRVTFGYVLTGDRETDSISKLGLSGLSRVLTRRTAVSPGDPIGVDIINDEIAFFPVLYWPVLPTTKSLPEKTLAKIDAYMKQGGLIVFDTKDYGLGVPSGRNLSGNEKTPLQRILGRLDIPRLEPVPQGHVLTKSFYLLQRFPGRWDSGQLWVEAGSTSNNGQGARRATRTDGVTSIMITSNDFAAAWAIDERGRPYYPTVPRSEVQREMAFRTGINIVMHALTGNYKSDQVHVPALLQRLGQ